MFIGQASKESGATIKAIRLYEQIGLLKNISRVNSYRVYTQDDVFIIRFIKVAQTFGFNLSELKHIIYPDGELAGWENIREVIALKEQSLTHEILKLQENKKLLQSYKQEIKQCLSDDLDCKFPQPGKGVDSAL